MKKIDLLKKIEKAGIIGVVRGATKEEAINVSNALIEGGVCGIELTYTVPEASQAIKELVQLHQDNTRVIIGAGTVMDVVTAKLAIEAGAEFIVSPSFDIDTARLCNLNQVPYLPGAFTITEMSEALKAGVDIIKLFPGSAVGPSYISAVKGPLPQINIMPTGGVNEENLSEWIDAGVVAVGIGSNLTSPFKGATLEDIEKTASRYMSKFSSLKNK